MRPFAEVLGTFIVGGFIAFVVTSMFTTDARYASVAFVLGGAALDTLFKRYRTKKED